MNIWMVNPFEPLPVDGFPLGRFRQLARELGGRGHQVLWWSSDFFHFLKRRRDGTHEPTAEDPYSVCMVPTRPYRTNTSLARIGSHGRLAAGTYYRFLRKMREHHKTRAKHQLEQRPTEAPPPSLVLCGWLPLELSAATAYFANQHGVPLCLDVTDPWPDSFSKVLPPTLKPLAPVLLGPHRTLSRWTLRQASAITAVSQTFLDWALEARGRDRSVASAVFYPAARARRDSSPRDAPGRTVRVVFAGTLGAMYDFDLMLSGAKMVEERIPGRTRFYFAGSGPRDSELRSRAVSSNVEFTGALNEEDLNLLLSRCDLGLCCFPPWASTTLTTKLFHYLSYGIPVLGTPQPEMSQFLDEHGVGTTIHTAEDLADAVVCVANSPKNWSRLSRFATAFSAEHDLEQEMSRMADFLLGQNPTNSPDSARAPIPSH